MYLDGWVRTCVNGHCPAPEKSGEDPRQTRQVREASRDVRAYSEPAWLPLCPRALIDQYSDFTAQICGVVQTAELEALQDGREAERR